ncbi:NAD-dependent epimerase [Fervidibacillus halotolerans]|uniref:NAD-dependent epimerase n=1 Tax=Fervidibacillus halotolerans TaxID=2980027 RepID=A0A9E8M0C4_9BACI|nr:NAD-dependent epimerase [Fervidibacillus halotolerans]WAA13138.1 NAD-dependent epimerase [Fervidibacillus halotolerans]
MGIIVTGCAGFIGFHLTKRLLKDGNWVIGIDNMNDYYDPSLKEKRLAQLLPYETFTFFQIDLENKKGLENIFDTFKPEVVINLGAQAGVRYSLENPQSYIDSNMTGFLNILEESKRLKVKHLIYASSSSVYGLNKKMPFRTSDRVDHPISIYAATKRANELFAHAYSYLYNLPTTGLRFFTVYGPWGRPDMALFRFTEAIFQGETIQLYNYGNMKRDFTYIDDIVEAIVRLIPQAPVERKEKELSTSQVSVVPFRLYNIGNNQPVKLMELIHAIEEYLGKKAIIQYLPLQPGDVPETYADVDDLYETIDFRPKTSVKEGVRKFIDWYLEFKREKNIDRND